MLRGRSAMQEPDARLATEDTLVGEGDRPVVGDPQLVRAGTSIGRYLVLERLGAGGMGVVWSAYDPELDRKVAIKLLHADVGSSSGHTRLLREAQALARLAHPNVVTVHDVGTHGEAVFVAMELVTGTTLSAWVRAAPRRWSEILEVLLAAGSGVAAAHDAGLVHRDIKPDNIMIGSDDRVRVMDFGLARDGGAPIAAGDELSISQSLTRVDITMAGAIVGTPAYMPPEQWAGELPHARGDQFSFCVTCWEALYGELPFRGSTLAELGARIASGQAEPPPAGTAVPRWVARTLGKGLATRADDRFLSLRDLLGALQAGRRRARRRTIGFGLLAAAVVASAVVGERMITRHRAELACAATAEEIHALWPGDHDEVRAEIRARFSATALDYADDAFTRAAAGADVYAHELRDAIDQQCRVDAAQPSTGAASGCLDERRSALATLLEDFRDADSVTVQRATAATLGLPRISDCLDETFVARRGAPDDPELARAVAEVRVRLEVARTHERAGRYSAALREVEAASERAKAIAWAPLVAEVHSVLGNVALALGDYERSERELLDAFAEATAAGDDDLAVAAASAMVNLVGGIDGRHAEGMVWAHVTEALLERLGDVEGLRGANYLAELGNLEHSRGDPAAAERSHRRALELHAALLGEHDLAVAKGHARLGADALAVGDTTRAIDEYERAVALFEAILGSDHPDLADYLNGLGGTRRLMGDDREAERLFARAARLLERSVGAESVPFAQSLSNVALVRLERGDPAGALPELERALGILERALGRDHLDLSTVLMNLGLSYAQLGRLEQAEEVVARALAIRESVLGVDHPAVARSLVLAGELRLSQRRATEAVPLLERALRVMTTHEVAPAQLGEAELELGMALFESSEDERRGVALVQSARDRFAVDPRSNQGKLAEADAWLRAHADRRQR